jgi:putative ABC transport system substrate-binding protein
MNKSVWLLPLVLAFGHVAEAQMQQPTKLRTIGWLGTRSASAPAREFFTEALRQIGYVEGKNITIEYRYAESRFDKLPALADELVRLRVDVLVTPATRAAIAARNATKTIPIVFYTGSDPVAAGLVDSLPRPGGNMTGFSTIAAVLAGKRLELLKETIPKLVRVAALWDPQDLGSAQSWKESLLPARELGLQLHSIEVGSPSKFDAAFKGAKANSDGLIVMASPFFYSNQKQIVGLAGKNRLPAIYPDREFVESGGLISYAADPVEPYKRVAVFVDKILKGAKPADLPIEQPTKFELLINLRAANRIDLAIPQNVLARADRVIK